MLQSSTWLPEITLKRLHVGAAVLTIHFFREANGVSNYEVLSKEGTVHVVRQPSPWSLTANFGERGEGSIEQCLALNRNFFRHNRHQLSYGGKP